MIRRDFLKLSAVGGAAALATGSAAVTANLSNAKEDMNRTHRMRLAELAADCIEQAKLCRAHCIDLLSVGETQMSECLRSVTEMLPACETLETYASMDSTFIKDSAKLCEKVCSVCEKVCREHEKSHAICRDCADSCLELVGFIRKKGMA